MEVFWEQSAHGVLERSFDVVQEIQKGFQRETFLL
jgi:hypothetical protein